MARLPFFIPPLVAGSGFAWTVHLLVAPDPWAVDAGMAIAIGTLMFSLIAMAALLLSRGRWTRYFAAGVVTAELAIGIVAKIDAWAAVGIGLGGLALAGLGGPWLQGWLRERPAAGSPGYRPMTLAFGLLGLVPAVGLAAPAGLQPAHGVLGATGILLGWAYTRSRRWAIWSARFVIPVLIVGAAAASPTGGAVLLVVIGIGLTYLAWTREARLAVDPLPAVLPAPRKRPTDDADPGGSR